MAKTASANVKYVLRTENVVEYSDLLCNNSGVDFSGFQVPYLCSHSSTQAWFITNKTGLQTFQDLWNRLFILEGGWRV